MYPRPPPTHTHTHTHRNKRRKYYRQRDHNYSGSVFVKTGGILIKRNGEPRPNCSHNRLEKRTAKTCKQKKLVVLNINAGMLFSVHQDAALICSPISAVPHGLLDHPLSHSAIQPPSRHTAHTRPA